MKRVWIWLARRRWWRAHRGDTVAHGACGYSGEWHTPYNRYATLSGEPPLCPGCRHVVPTWAAPWETFTRV